ncbi:MAG: hypothetical protein V1822_00300, partial [Candidatus Micrarchaeota archaeon]
SPSYFQATFSIFNPDYADQSSKWGIDWNELASISLSSVRLNKAYLYSNLVHINKEDTVINYSQTYTTLYTPQLIASTSWQIKTPAGTYDLSPSAAFSPAFSQAIPFSYQLQLTNIGNRHKLSVDYLRVSHISGSRAYVDGGISTGNDYLRLMFWGDDILGNQRTLNFGGQFTPNVFFPDNVNYYLSNTWYAMFRERNFQATVLGLQAIAGTRLDLNIANTAVLGAIVEYNSFSGAKPSGYSFWLSLSIPAFSRVSN